VNSKVPPRSRRYFYIFCLIFGFLATLLVVLTVRTLREVHQGEAPSRENAATAQRGE